MNGLTGPERELVDSVEAVIGMTHAGTSPDDAIYKVASEKQYGPAMVQRMVEAYNKSKSVHILKTAAAEDRVKPFDLASTDAILSRMYGIEKAAAGIQQAQIPSYDLSASDIPQMEAPQMEAPQMESAAPPALEMPEMEMAGAEEKVASEVTESEDVRLRRHYMLKQACDKLERRLYEDHLEAKRQFDRVLDRCVDHVRGISDEQFQKVARMVLNGYPTTGESLLRIMSNRTRKPLPEMEKTAKAVVFPTQEPFLSIAELYDRADAMVRAEYNIEQFRQKQADSEGILQDFLQRTSDSALTGGGEFSPERLGEILSHPFRSPRDSIETKLDPEFHNRIRGLGARRKFVNMLLYDKDISGYDDTDVLRAYNEVVTAVPGADANPEVLRNLILRNLQTGGVKDVFELKGESELAEKLTKVQALQAAGQAAAAREAKERKPEEKDYRPSAVRSSGSLLGSALSGTFDTAAELTGKAQEALKERSDKAKARLDAKNADRTKLVGRIQSALYRPGSDLPRAVYAYNRSLPPERAHEKIPVGSNRIVDPRGAETIADMMSKLPTTLTSEQLRMIQAINRK